MPETLWNMLRLGSPVSLRRWMETFDSSYMRDGEGQFVMLCDFALANCAPDNSPHIVPVSCEYEERRRTVPEQLRLLTAWLSSVAPGVTFDGSIYEYDIEDGKPPLVVRYLVINVGRVFIHPARIEFSGDGSEVLPPRVKGKQE
jgi:hypothetical protein